MKLEQVELERVHADPLHRRRDAVHEPRRRVPQQQVERDPERVDVRVDRPVVGARVAAVLGHLGDVDRHREERRRDGVARRAQRQRRLRPPVAEPRVDRREEQAVDRRQVVHARPRPEVVRRVVVDVLEPRLEHVVVRRLRRRVPLHVVELRRHPQQTRQDHQQQPADGLLRVAGLASQLSVRRRPAAEHVLAQQPRRAEAEEDEHEVHRRQGDEVIVDPRRVRRQRQQRAQEVHAPDLLEESFGRKVRRRPEVDAVPEAREPHVGRDAPADRHVDVLRVRVVVRDERDLHPALPLVALRPVEEERRVVRVVLD
mmetsp:Transcript_28231/g.87337  ORF Transcript_28231/g.87337 Transcript_28231/m.87337 type:complete len:314 (+) Transcript_28231:457-1398(+)